MYEYHGNKGSRRQQEIKEPLTLYRAGGFLFISCRRYQTDHLQIYSGGVRILNVQLEGSGGIVCPIRWDKEHKILLEDIVKALNLNTLVIADAGLGTINAVVLTIEYIRNHGMGVKGVILNHYVGGIMQEDNARMIEELTGIAVIAKVKDGDGELAIDIEKLKKIYN